MICPICKGSDPECSWEHDQGVPVDLYEKAIRERDTFKHKAMGLEVVKTEMLPKLLAERDEARNTCHQQASLRADLELAIKYLREGKAKFAPGTTNSFVDDLLAKYPHTESKETK